MTHPIQQVHALVCTLFGVRVGKDSLSNGVNYLGFESKIVDNQLLLYNQDHKASFSFFHTHEDTVALFRYFYQRLGPILQSYMWKEIPQCSLYYPLPPLRVSTLDLALILQEICGALRVTSDKHRVYVALESRNKLWSLHFTGTLATARCITCRRRMRATLLTVKVGEGHVTGAEALVHLFYSFHHRHRHIEPCQETAPDPSVSNSIEFRESNGTTCTPVPSPPKSNPILSTEN